MFDLIIKAAFIHNNPQILIPSNIIIFLIGFIYSYAFSFVFNFKKVLIIGFFVVIVSSITALSFAGIYVTSTQCTAMDGSHLCTGLFGAIGPAAASLMLLLSNLFINLVVGMFSVLLGMVFYFPSDLFIKKFTKLPSINEYEKVNDYINSTSKNVTFGNRKISQNQIESVK